MQRVEIVTPSHGPDAPLCELLVESVERHVDASIGHTILVPRRDRRAFAHLEGPRTRLVDEEEAIGRRVRHVPGWRKVHVVGTRPVRGWHLQQIVKLGVPAVVDADVLVLIDSDSVFCRPFGASHVVEGGRARLFANRDQEPMLPHSLWHRESARLLGLPSRDWFGADYISHVPVWRRDAVVGLQERLAEVGGRSWESVVARTWNFSEYTLYGIYVEHVMPDAGASTHAPTALDLAHSSWRYPIGTEEGRQAFLAGLEPHHVVIGIQSKDPVPLAQRRDLVAALTATA